MSEIPEDIKEAAYEAMRHVDERGAHGVISNAMLAERNRCLSIVNGMEAHTTLEYLMLETIVRKMRGDE